MNSRGLNEKNNICYREYECWGTEKALLSMISEIPKDKFDITIFILKGRGGFLKSIPNYINIKF